MSDDKMPELTDAQKAALIEAYIRSKPTRDLVEKRRREQARLNNDEAIRRRIGVDDDDHWGI